MMNFIGRTKELEQLNNLKEKKTASIVCVLGRRRIGKSALIQEFGKKFKRYIEIQGLGPHEEKNSKKVQLEHFALELSIQFNIKRPHFEDWDEAFILLAELTNKGDTLILLDEISWMAKGDEMFSAKLKSAWDSKIKKNNKLILVLCGSVSTWIENNILKHSSFEGRISLEINLKELELNHCNFFFTSHAGDLEKMIALSITGGVPKYLEELRGSKNLSKTLADLCFSESGILFNDFEKIFLNIFQRRSGTYEKIIRGALDQKLSPKELAKKTKIEYNSDFTQALHALELSGFLSRDYYFNPIKQEQSKFSHLRVKDNYLRFYLKVIEPLKAKILKGAVQISDLSELKGMPAILGYQFENILLANKDIIHQKLGIVPSSVISSASYVQKKNTLNKGGCQIDLLIHTNLDLFFLCEFKTQNLINKKVISEVKKRMEIIKIPRRSAIKPILIYLGEIDQNDKDDLNEFFHKMIYFGDLLR